VHPDTFAIDHEARRLVFPMRNDRLSIPLLWLAVAAHGFVLWLAWQWFAELPERFPVHFDLAGRPDGWSTKSPTSWFLAPGIGVVLGAFLTVLAMATPRLALRHAKLVNMPRKAQFLALPPEGRAAAMLPTRWYLLALVVLLAGLFGWIVDGSARVAVGQWQELPPWPVLAFVGLVVGLLPVYLWLTVRTIDAATRRAQQGQQAAAAG